MPEPELPVEVVVPVLVSVVPEVVVVIIVAVPERMVNVAVFYRIVVRNG